MSRPSVSCIASASVNLMKNLMGAAIFSLPQALGRSSVLPGLITMFGVCVVQASSFVLIAVLCQQYGAQTYRGICSAAFGQKSGRIVDFLISTNSFFICVAYQILVADFLQKAVHGLFGWDSVSRSALIWGSMLTMTMPLSHVRNLSPLQYTSVMGLAIIVLVYLYIVSDCLENLDIARLNLGNNLMRIDMGIFSTLFLCTETFQAHYNAPKFFRELGFDLRAHAYTTAVSFSGAFLIYSSFAVAGLGLFGSNILGNVLRNYPVQGNNTILLAWLGMAFAIIFTYPLVFTTGRDSLISLVPQLRRMTKRQPRQMHVLLTCSLVAATAMVGCFLDDVSRVTEFLGATIGSCLCWILPAIIYLKSVLLCPSSAELESAHEPLLPKLDMKLQRLPTAGGVLIAYTSAMVAVGCLAMSVGVSDVFGFI
mmetsp:Transcript_9185/g.17555  ORF Transcript_9185/g.17555 Transcript_9185/m.17555 type:complete len:424 (+) Transcript_9185:67-1338(+)